MSSENTIKRNEMSFVGNIFMGEEEGRKLKRQIFIYRRVKCLAFLIVPSFKFYLLLKSHINLHELIIIASRAPITCSKSIMEIPEQ